jgi:hypothetical protein
VRQYFKKKGGGGLKTGSDVASLLHENGTRNTHYCNSMFLLIYLLSSLEKISVDFF